MKTLKCEGVKGKDIMWQCDGSVTGSQIAQLMEHLTIDREGSDFEFSLFQLQLMIQTFTKHVFL
jgi:hypothetical protein